MFTINFEKKVNLEVFSHKKKENLLQYQFYVPFN